MLTIQMPGWKHIFEHIVFFVVWQVKRCDYIFTVWNFRQASIECLRVYTNKPCLAVADTAMPSFVTVVGFGIVQANYAVVQPVW